MTLYDKLSALASLAHQSAWVERISCELNFAAELSTVNSRAYDALIETVLDTLLAKASENGALTRTDCLEAEKALAPLSKEAKSYRVHCIAHAHIDMNWMWGFNETTAVTVDTFRTVLDLMKEYPDLTFGQSQASTYKIIEEYAPEMLDEIRERIAEGRWEVTASTWVECDKNMTSGESLARHILYTRRYLSSLLNIPAESMNLDFEPDTFGHNISVPEICAKGGVKYYYHCRGNRDNEVAYRWRARSGAELLVWQEPEWYNYDVNGDMFRNLPQRAAKYGLKSWLSVYGVGDHGGGPTRRDVTRLIEIASWPIMPTVMFSTFAKFYSELEAIRDTLPIREGELNFVFTGCYTTQSRIKLANRLGEDRIYESELLSAAAHILAGEPRRNESYSKAWERILFNHFHDILPGSGVIETREYALGRFQEAMATVQTNANLAMRAIAERIDTSSLAGSDDSDGRSEGSAVGFMTGADGGYSMPQSERGQGRRRILHLFNPNQYDFDGVTDVTVWDWNYDAGLARFTTPDGEALPIKLMANDSGYWGHKFKKFALKVKIPALGYTTVVLDAAERPVYSPGALNPASPRSDGYGDGEIILENSKLRASFDHRTMQLVSLTDKSSGRELVKAPTAYFRLIKENTVHGMTSWRVGDVMSVENLNETREIRVCDINQYGIRKWIRYELSFGAGSRLSVVVMLDEDSSMLKFETKVEFLERFGGCIPQLNFYAPVGYAVSGYRYDVPFGTLDRPDIAHDVPANSFCAALPEEGESSSALMLISDSKYGFRGHGDAMALTLIRAAGDPDPYPEYGSHRIMIGLGLVGDASNATLYRAAESFVHPISVCSARGGSGELPLSGQLVRVDGDVKLTSVKTPEDFDGLAIRLSDISGKGGDVKLSFTSPLTAAFDSDINERELRELPFDGGSLALRVEPYKVRTLLLRF